MEPPDPGAKGRPATASTPPSVAPAARGLPRGDRFDVETALGAAVSLARDARLERRVVVERMPASVSDETLVRLRELARVSSPHLQPILDLLPPGEDGEEGFVVYHLVEGSTLAERAAAGCDEARARRIGADLARALVDHPGPLRPGRVRLVGDRAILPRAGTVGLVDDAPPPDDARPSIARVMRWVRSGRDPGEDPADLIDAFREVEDARGTPPPAAPAELARWLDAGQAPE